ncbi:MAG: ACR3 family arsenite efflux transporter [Sandaracinus sp.]|nr:ACR3 family arsenite efflux transporter [Sandaracinus sp.]MCB9622607.1 ACR3 family arsenite efflux transporter [Sandaracinus sp.]
MGLFERYLSLWIAAAIGGGVWLGSVARGAVEVVASLELARVNLVVAVLIWGMIYPMMLKVDPACVREVGRRPKGLLLTLGVNWLIKPFTMAALGWIFFRVLFADLVSTEDAGQYVAGMILLGVAPCTAMVFVWSHLTKGDAAYTLVQVSVNDLVMVVAFAPIAGLLLGVSDVVVPWSTLLLSVVLFVVVPLAAGLLTRKLLADEARLDRLGATLKPVSIVALLLTVVLLFSFQAELLIARPERVALVAVPLLVQSYGIFALGYGLAKLLKLPHAVAAPAALIGTSNFFELAVAVAISLYGLDSGAAFATVVGVLIEVPVMLSLVAFANRTRGAFPAAAAV